MAIESKIPNDAEFKKLWHSKATCKEIGQRYGVCSSTVNLAAKRCGFPSKRIAMGQDHRLIVHDTPQFREAWLSDVSVAALAKTLNVSDTTLRKAASRYGYGPKGGSKGNAPVQSASVEKIFPKTQSEAAPKAFSPLATDFWTPDRDAAVIATYGKYAKVAALADRWGIPSQRIMTRWQKLRVAA